MLKRPQRYAHTDPNPMIPFDEDYNTQTPGFADALIWLGVSVVVAGSFFVVLGL